MNKFTDTVIKDTPRLVVMHGLNEQGQDIFQWGMVGSMPLVTLIGYIVRVQAELAFRSPEPCDQRALCIAWDEATRTFTFFVHPDIPVDSMVGMLEAIKTTLNGTHLARQQAAQQVRILGPDGSPYR